MGIIISILSAIVPLIGFIYGRCAFRNNKALYPRLIVDGVGSIALGRIFEFVKLLTENERPQEFHIGILSMFGVFAFFLSANFGQINTLCDDGTPKYKNYRIVSIVAPAFLLITYILLFERIESVNMKIVYGILCALIGFADYFHLKLFLLPDVNFGIAKCLRTFNILALAYSLLCVAEVFLKTKSDLEPASAILHAAMIIVSGCLVPAAVKGVKKWTV